MKGVVYFIRAGGNVKIGTTQSLSSRISQLQTGCAEPLEVLASVVGDRTLEAHYHEVFAADRKEGEWFEATPALLEVALQLATYGEDALPKGFAPEVKVRVQPTAEHEALARMPQEWAKKLIRMEWQKVGNIEIAMRRLARRYNVPYYVLWDLRYRPPKDTSVLTYFALRDAYIAECEAELRRVEHQLEVHRALEVPTFS